MATPKGTVYKRCACKDPDTGKPLNQRCPQLTSRKHGTHTFDVRLDTTKADGRRLKRAGYPSATKAEEALEHVRDLVKLAGDDDRLRRRIGDLIFERSRRRGALPTVAEVRRRLGAGDDVTAPAATVAEWMEEWYAIKKRTCKRSTLVGYRNHIDNFIVPLLGDIPRDNLRPEHILGMFDRIDEWNEALAEAKAGGRPYHMPDDRRKLKKVTGLTHQHHVLWSLRAAYTMAVKRPGMINWNPCSAVELPPIEKGAARVWSPDQVVTFLAHAAEDRLGLLYRIVVLRGMRRGEVLGLRWGDLDADDRGATIVQTVLQLSGKVVFDTPKSAAGKRWVALDADTATQLGALRRLRRRERLAAGEAWQEHDLVFCREDGTPLRPTSVSLHFQRLAKAAGLPVIKLHEGRHTAATLGLEAGLDIKVVSAQLGHSDTSITRDLYTHVREAVHDDAAEKIVDLLGRGAAGQETGS